MLGWHRNVSFNVHPPMFYRHLSPHIPRVVPNFLWTARLGFLMTCLLFFSDSSYSLLADDVLGSYLLCPHPKKPKCGSLIIRFPSGLVTHLIENTRKGKYLIEVKCFNKLNGQCQASLSYVDKATFFLIFMAFSCDFLILFICKNL